MLSPRFGYCTDQLLNAATPQLPITSNLQAARLPKLYNSRPLTWDVREFWELGIVWKLGVVAFGIGHERMKAKTSSRLAVMSSSVVASRFRRSMGSVFDPRTLKCQSGYSTDTPSIV